VSRGFVQAAAAAGSGSVWLRVGVALVWVACVVVVMDGAAAGAGAARHAIPSVRPGGGRVRSMIEPQVCSSCKPPLLYSGGPVLAANTAAGLTITPVYWQPSGYSFPAGFEQILNGYIANIAAASGKTDNVYSVAAEYYEKVNGAKTSVDYAFKAGTRMVDTNPFPANGCTPASGYSACLTDDQLRAELKQVTAAHNLPTDLAHFYPVFFPPKVELQDRDGTTSVSGFCGYHRNFGSGSSQTVYADMPFDTSGCDQGQAPNGLRAADGEIDSFSHELNEAITDPLNPQYAWSDKAGGEMGDMCTTAYGKPLGSTDPSDPKGSEYNQVINGGKYYTQSEFSNLAYQKLGFGKGCALSEALAQNPSAAGTGAQATTVGAVTNDATPNTLPADGKSTSTVAVGVATPQNENVTGDHVHFRVGLESGTGQCGTLNSSDVNTDANGYAHVTYTASSDDVACWVLADESLGGNSAQAVIYQGTTQKQAPTYKAAYPTSLTAGASPTTFTIVAVNPTSTPIPNTRPYFSIFPGNNTKQNLTAKQVHLLYTTTGPKGTFTAVHLSGSTADGNVIQGYVGPQQGTTLPANSTTTYTFHVNLDHNVPVSKATPIAAFESYLDQINTASGSGATLADTYAYQVKVPTATNSSTNTLWYILIGIAAAVCLALLGLFFWRRHGQPPAAARAV